MQCLYRNRDDLLLLRRTQTSGTKKKTTEKEPWCKCDRNCDDSNFFVQDLVSGQNVLLIAGDDEEKVEIVLKTLRCPFVRLVASTDFRLQRSRAWFLGANLQYGITEYPKIQLRRNVLFRFEDLLGELSWATGCGT